MADTVTEILAGVLRGEPDWAALPAATPEQVRVLLRRCLQKDKRCAFVMRAMRGSRSGGSHSAADSRAKHGESDKTNASDWPGNNSGYPRADRHRIHHWLRRCVHRNCRSRCT